MAVVAGGLEDLGSLDTGSDFECGPSVATVV